MALGPRWLVLVVVGMVVTVAVCAWASGPVVRPPQASVMVMVADVRVSLLGRRTGARLEVRRARVQGRVEASGGPVATALNDLRVAAEPTVRVVVLTPTE